jgi:serine/threonine protein kinase
VNTHAVPTNWVGIPPQNDVMATGAEGIVHLWCDIDPNTRIIRDRVVVKNVVSGSARYMDPHNWANGIVGGKPLEYHQANVIWAATPPAHQQHIQGCLGWGGVVPTTVPIAQQTFRFKLYNEYCAHGNLHRLMKTQPKRKKWGAKKKGKKSFPEPFLWYMFESLAKACAGMEAAYTHPNGTSDGVVHQ